MFFQVRHTCVRHPRKYVKDHELEKRVFLVKSLWVSQGTPASYLNSDDSEAANAGSVSQESSFTEVPTARRLVYGAGMNENY